MLVHTARSLLGWTPYDYSATQRLFTNVWNAVCNRPTCSTSASVDTDGYQEDSPKRVSNVVTVWNPKILKSMQRNYS